MKSDRLLADELRKAADAVIVDVIGAMQEAAKAPVPLYPTDINGHPLAAGYAVIANTLAGAVEPFLPAALPDGLVGIQRSANEYSVFLVLNGHAWLVPSPEIATDNGWFLDNIPLSDRNTLNRVPLVGRMSLDPVRFGPR